MSSEHWKLEPGSELKSKLGVLSAVVPCGAEVIVATGAAMSTVKSSVAAGPVLPAPSVARTRKVWAPLESFGASKGLLQGLKSGVPVSSEHWKLEPGSELKSKLGVLSAVVPCGAEVIVAVGAAMSTVKSSVAAGPVLPAPSVARTRKVWAPLESFGASKGLLQGLKSAVPVSSEHWKLEPGSELKSKLGVLSAVVPCGAEVIVAVGPAVSTVKSSVAAGPVLPAPSVARTRKVWAPLESFGASKGLLQGWKSAVPVSSEHWKLEPGSELKSKLGVLSAVVPCGAEVIVAVGRGDVDREVLGGGRAGVAGAVGGPHPEGVGAVGELRRVEGAAAGAGSRRAGVERALEARARIRAEVEARGVVGGGAVRGRGDRRGGRGGVDREVLGGGRAGVAGAVGGPHPEGVGAVGELRRVEGAAAGAEGGGAGVERALEGGARIRAEVEARGVVGGGAVRGRGDRRDRARRCRP